ncbi:RHS repeat-associated core domain [Chthonomonas calidirosea]|uniref:RHS repeat-associated core domain n=1 Tax=Chthonomonas calidirosea (strain DSM 23976 / ICMP 18418 / T49) TaxID=1303518 RepID=S0ESB1_CHTCT|nr:RHS repeat-associated core domain-containing protein [Chthonomonas calidirosea]CCW34014.1 RHS repeat-associated core domain [Chthonomonas calidirosea T49]CEK16007.1 RHS repeat-associated core domain [Chthonomonas calidirosea]
MKTRGYGGEQGGQAGSSSEKYVGRLGHESDGSTGLIYMQARYMDPVLGRFISEDPSRDGVNWFVYCADDPVNQVDRTGKLPLSNWVDFIIWCLFEVFFVALAAFYDPKGYTDLKIYIQVGSGIIWLVSTLAGVWYAFLRPTGEDTIKNYRDRIERLEQEIDDEKTSMGEGSFARRLDGYFAEEILN